MKKIIAIILIILIFTILLIPKSGIKGIDVSHHNDYNVAEYVLSNNDIKYIIAKATEGSTFIDKKYELYRAIARTNNLYFGAYHFLNFNTPSDLQFKNYTNVVEKSDIDFKPVLDIELHENKEYPNREKLIKLVKEFGELCKQYYGIYPIIYCNEDFRIRYFLIGFDEYPFWIRNLFTNTKCDIQQYKIDNEYNIDLNKIYNINNLLING